MSILTQIGKGFRVAGRGAFIAPDGKMVSPLIRGALEYGAYSAGASLLEKYAEGNFEHEGSKNAASVASFLLKAKGIHSFALGGTRTIGEIGARIGQRYHGETGRKIAGLLTSLRGAGKDAIYAPTGKTRLVQKFNNSTYTFAGLPRVKQIYGSTLKNRAAGAADKFLSGLNPLTLPFRGAMWVAKGALTFPHKAASGAVEYGRVARDTWKATGAHGNAAGWGTMALGLADIKHPLAPMIAGGVLLGGTKAMLERHQIGPNGWEESQYSAPLTDGSAGALGSVDPTNFPGGMTVGRGRSAIRSQTVMEGQSAVTSKMLTHRRV